MSKRALPAGTRIGQYVITGFIERSDYAVRYAAHNPLAGNGDGRIKLDEYFPVNLSKRVDDRIRCFSDFDAFSTFEAGLQDFVTVAKRAMHVRHPALVSTIDCVQVNDTAYIVSERPEGHAYRTEMISAGLISPEWAESIVSMIVPALAQIEASGLVHGHVSPDAILKLSDGYPMLDISPQYLQRGEPTTQSSFHAATAFAAPELGVGVTPALPDRADIYSLSASLFYLVTGRPPTPAQSSETMPALLDPIFASFQNRSLQSALTTRLVGGLQREPDERPASIEAWWRSDATGKKKLQLGEPSRSSLFGMLRRAVGQ